MACITFAADPTGTISGNVTDPSGLAIVGAQITVRNSLTGLTRSATSDNQGAFLFPLMPVGSYEISVELKGFRRFEQRGITVMVNGVASLQVTLQIGLLTESVTVEADAIMVETRSGTIKSVVDQERIVELPLNGRNAAALVTLVAGTVDLGTGNARGAGDAVQAGTYPATQITSSSGGRSDGMNFLLDGGSNRDPYTNVNNPFPNPDGLQEFVVQTNNYSAEYGRASGAIVSVVTKSGTNQLHGNAFEFLRNEAFNARNFFSPMADILKRHQFGGGLGGPIVKDKLFYFGTIQGTTLRAIPASSSLVSISSAQRAGDFSAITAQIKDPTTGTPYPRNQIPVSQFAPASVKLLDWLPVPTSPTGVVYYTRPDFEHELQFTGKVDHNTSRNRLSGRYSIFDFTKAVSVPKGNLPGAVYGLADRVQNIAGNDTYTFSSRLLNTFTFSYDRNYSNMMPAAPFSFASLGVKIAGTAIPELGISASGYFSVSTNHTGLFARQNYNVADAVHWIRGGHELSMGLDYLKTRSVLVNEYRMSGSFSFNGTITGNALADFLLGSAYSFTQGGGEFADRRGTLVGTFFQDNYRASRRLTLNLGVRYDPYVPFGDAEGRTECYHPGQRSARYPNSPVGYIFQGDPGCPGASNFLTFAPRIGFSFDTTGRGKTIIRGGYGIFYQPPFAEAFNNMVDSAPFSPQMVLNNVSFMDPYKGMTNPFPAAFGPAVPGSTAQFQTPIVAVSYADDWKPTEVQSWNFTLEHQLRPDLLLRAAYVASKGTFLAYNTDLNPAVYVAGATSATTNQRRPLYNTGFARITQDQAAGNSIYNSLQTTIEKRFSHSFSVLANYTWSKSIDYNSGQRDLDGVNIINPWNVRAYRGLSDFSVKHGLVVSYLWRLPMLPNSQALVRHALGGWEASGIWKWASGFPLSVTSSEDRALSGIGADLADLVGNPFLDPNRARKDLIARYFNTSAFTLAAMGTFGNSGRNILIGPGTFNIDLGAMKNFKIRERFNVQFRAEAFNLLNMPQLNNPNTSVTAPQYGQITSARAARIIQLAVKWRF
jgi:hypothetical protein